MLPPSRLDKFSLYEMLGARLFGQEKHKQVHRKGNFSQIFRSRNINNSISEHNFQRNPNQFKLAWLKPHIDSINDKNYIIKLYKKKDVHIFTFSGKNRHGRNDFKEIKIMVKSEKTKLLKQRHFSRFSLNYHE